MQRIKAIWDLGLSKLSGSSRLGEPMGGAGTYTVQPGDSLSAIAQRLLGDSGRWRELYDQNRSVIGANPNLIVAGQVLSVPGGAPSAPAPTPAPAQVTAYTVQAGDTLGVVAQRTLGDSGRWQEVFNANRDQIANPNLIFPGMVLRVPNGAHSPASAPVPSAPAPAGKLAWPVQGPITSAFGYRIDPISGQRGVFHTGMDIGAPAGTPVQSPLPGKVIYAGWINGGGGNHVQVDHGNGLITTYSHMSAINVSVGQQVGVGQAVGRVGSTGYSTGPHLHFEVKRNGQYVDPGPLLA
jgi:murein DD-endopeptidase MepM/ murein hydrolase activator NlpD